MTTEILLNEQQVLNKIFLIRGQKVMLDQDLAELYGIETRRLNEQVKRNIERFPEDFMFELTDQEYVHLMSQIATSSWGGRRKRPYAFTEYGVLMLSSVLSSKTAIQVNIKIMRVYAKFREMLIAHQDILIKLEQLEHKIQKQDQKTNKQEEDIDAIFNALKQLLQKESKPRKKVGFRIHTS